MRKISIISGSIREGRASHRVALFFKAFLTSNKDVEVEILDLAKYKFPLFEERLKFQKNPSAGALDFAKKINEADGVILVTPEYNGGYPAAVKNAIDLLNSEWKRKPVAITTVSDGSFGGSQVLQQVQFSLWKIGACTVPAMFPVPKVVEMFDEKGVPLDPEKIAKRATNYINELFYQIDAREKMKS